MNDRFLMCLADTLLPGDDGEPPLPPGSGVGVHRALAGSVAAEDGGAYRRAVSAVARAAGDAHSFVRCSGDVRAAAVADAENARPLEMRALITRALEVYYQSPEVITAMGWRPQSPQPLGHSVDALDATLLDPVRSRSPLWRQV